MSQADSACCCRGLSRAMSKVAHERSTCLTVEIIPSLWKPKTGLTLMKSTLPKRSAPPTSFRSRARKQASGLHRDDLGRSGMKKHHPENHQLLFCFLRQKRVWLQVPSPTHALSWALSWPQPLSTLSRSFQRDPSLEGPQVLDPTPCAKSHKTEYVQLLMEA